MKALILSLFIFSGCASTPKSACNAKLRAVIDMGSGSTKLNMAEADTCNNSVKIKNKFNEDNARAVALEAAKNPAGEISPEARAAAIKALQELREVVRQKALAYKYNEFELAVVGTHALRSAANKDLFIKEIEAAHFTVYALTQDEEGEAGFNAALGARPESCSKDEVLVWDVGGGSTQFTRAPEGKTLFLNVGSEKFRARLLSKAHKPHKDSSCVSQPGSPNPIGLDSLSRERSMFEKMPARSAADLKAKEACVIGIGGVHAKAVFAQIQKNWNKVGPCACGQQPNCLPTPDGYNKKELLCLAELFATKNDCSPELKGPYAQTSATNLLMVLGFMDNLEIERVHVLNINMGDYFLTTANPPTYKTYSTE